ncbi:heterokaryon incompatibility protein-domain-containing protein [Lasiosphaeria ovina]|uniref:Heterokaryon incompatibility protein-domain-containing protein n=1 Tax=Lasiosphaeria ovina TaxID=92902 RepID=A0AAE0JX38_9PEZI|nr:heterokaryon incompatibility protein-domain-containing protein [Lasiosphaeria ovina]
MATPGPEFRYQPLLEPGETRVLYLHPGSGVDVLSGHLQHAQLSDRPWYEALSYEWGDPTKSHELRLQDGSIVRITESLHQALHDLRREPRSGKWRAVWADGICIDQANAPEVSAQVAIMGAIYRTAARVVTYIGPERDGSTMAIEFAQDLAEDAMLRGQEALVTDFPLRPVSDPHWPALRALLLRTWPSRCWCSQEFLLNENIILMCGRVEIHDWDLLPSIIDLSIGRYLPVYLMPGPEKDPNCLAECLSYLRRMRFMITENKTSFPLLTLLQLSHSFQVSDPRDKIYSLLGLAADRDRWNLAIDYTCSAEELYTTVASRAFAEFPDVSLLYSNLRTKSLALPSWCPDWSTWHFGSMGAVYDAPHMASGGTELQARVHRSENRLELAGCLVEQIDRIGSPVGHHYRRALAEDTAGRNEWLREQQELISHLGPQYPDGSADMAKVMWMTLVGALTFDQKPLHDRREQDRYQALYEAHLGLCEDSSDKEKEMAREFIDAVRRRSRYRRLATTTGKYLGAVPESAAVGDWVVMVNGSSLLFVVRPEAGGNFSLCGPAVLHVLHVLTKFPPTIRAMHIILQGSIPGAEECAGLIQACHGFVTKVVSTSTVAQITFTTGGKVLEAFNEPFSSLKISRGANMWIILPNSGPGLSASEKWWRRCQLKLFCVNDKGRPQSVNDDAGIGGAIQYAMVLATIYGLLLAPDNSDPIDITRTLDFHHDQVAFAEVARDYICKNATRTRAEWRAEIIGPKDQDVTDAGANAGVGMDAS